MRKNTFDYFAVIRGYFCFCAVIVCFLVFSLSFPPVVSGADDISPQIKLLAIKGNKKIAKELILVKIKSSVGTAFSQNSVQSDIKSIFSMGYFDDVKVEMEPFEGGIKLIFVIEEKPTVISIDFQGNKELETKTVKEAVTLTAGAIANHSLIMDNVSNIVSLYQAKGYRLAKVIPVTREISEDAVAITFQIEEGPKVKIRNITIKGNQFISSKKIKKAMKTKKRWFFSFITGSGFYREDEIKADLERIKELYHNNGYVDVAVSAPVVTLSPDKKKMFIEISVSEGEQYRIGEVSFKNNILYNNTELYQHVETALGEVYNKAALKRDIDNILELYTEKGYAVADVNPKIDVNRKERLISITLLITEGEIFRIGRIKIKGNQITRDKVIRREVRLDEGDIYNSKLLKRSYQRISNLNFFESVELIPNPNIQEQLIDVDVRVKEKLTGMLTVGGGYSSVDKFIVTGQITQVNLFGKGLYLKLKADLSASRTNYAISIKDPWFMDKPLSASLSIYNEVFSYPLYDKEALGGSIGLGKELSEYVSGNIAYRLEEVKISNIDENASSIIKDQEGTRLTSSISPSIWRDTRDSFTDPTTGSKNSLSTTYAGIGGDNYFVKALADSLWFFPFKWNTVFSLRGRVGYASGFAGKDLPLYERFYVGGIDTVRGLGFGEGGPRDEKGDVIGGTKEFILNAEFIFPLEKNIRLKGLVFFDAGSSFDNIDDATSLRTTAGFGIRWMSPFGPIRLEWGFNFAPKFDESSNKIEFAVGGIF